MDTIALAIVAAAVMRRATRPATGTTSRFVLKKCAQCSARRRVMRSLKPARCVSHAFATCQWDRDAEVSNRAAPGGEAIQAGAQGVLNAYGALKAVLAKKLGVDSKVNAVISDLEWAPDSDGYRSVLCRQLRKAKADQDPDILTATQVLLASLYAYPPGAQIVRRIADAARQRRADEA